jgi:hypothetical protein
LAARPFIDAFHTFLNGFSSSIRSVTSTDLLPSQLYLVENAASVVWSLHRKISTVCRRTNRQSIKPLLIIRHCFARFYLFRNGLGWQRMRRGRAENHKTGAYRGKEAGPFATI